MPDDAAGEGKLDLGVVELLDVGALGHGGRDGGRLDDLQARRAHPMPRRHLLHSNTNNQSDDDAKSNLWKDF